MIFAPRERDKNFGLIIPAGSQEDNLLFLTCPPNSINEWQEF